MDGKALTEMKTASPSHSIHRLITERWSPYGYSSKPVPPEELAAVFEAASWAASSFNEQPWRYLVASQSGDPEGFAKLLSCLSPPNQDWAKHAPVLAFSIAKKTFSHNGVPNRVAVHDVGAASTTLTFEATVRGLSIHQMAGLDAEAVRAACDVPDDFEVVAAIAIGYLASPDDVDSKLRERDAKPRTRKPLDEFIFTSQWEQAAELA